MLTFFKQLFVWWNQQTLGTRIQTILFGKFVGKDSFGNKYYKNKNDKRWVIYNGEIDVLQIWVRQSIYPTHMCLNRKEIIFDRAAEI